MKKSTQAEATAAKQPENAPQALASVVTGEDKPETPESRQAVPESPESEAAKKIGLIRKLLQMSDVSDEELIHYLQVVLDVQQSPVTASEGLPLSVVIDAINKAAQCPEVAQNLAGIEERVYRVDNPEEFSECEELIFSGVDVAQITRRVEIESAEVTAFDMVRLFLNKSLDVKAGLALFDIAARFAAK